MRVAGQLAAESTNARPNRQGNFARSCPVVTFGLRTGRFSDQLSLTPAPSGVSHQPVISLPPVISAQIACFSRLLYFPQTVFRCLPLSRVSSFQDGKVRPDGQVPKPDLRRIKSPRGRPGPDPQETLTVAQTKTATKTSKKTSSRSMKKSASRAAANAGDDAVTIDRRRSKERRDDEIETEESAAAPKLERRQKVSRRRQIDPTTCERDYTDQEVEFMNALDDYKRKSGRMFPTCSEVLEVIQSLGYVKTSPATGAAPISAPAASAKPMASETSEFNYSQI